VLWGSLAKAEHPVAAAATRRFGAAPRPVLAAGGASLAADATAVAEVKRAGAARIAVAVAAGHQPTGDVLEFLRRLRAAVSATTPIVVALLEVGDDGAFAGTGEQEGANWRRALATIGDSHLWVDAMERAS
jgi:CheY-like chemotaxis protein